MSTITFPLPQFTPQEPLVHYSELTTPKLTTQLVSESENSLTDLVYWGSMATGFCRTLTAATLGNLTTRFTINEIALLTKGYQAALPVLAAKNSQAALVALGLRGIPATIGLLALSAGSFYLINHFLEGGSVDSLSLTDFLFTMGMMKFNEMGIVALAPLIKGVFSRFGISFMLMTGWEGFEAVARNLLAGDTNLDHLAKAASSPFSLQASIQRTVFTAGVEVAKPATHFVEGKLGNHLNHTDMIQGAQNMMSAVNRWAKAHPFASGVTATGAVATSTLLASYGILHPLFMASPLLPLLGMARISQTPTKAELSELADFFDRSRHPAGQQVRNAVQLYDKRGDGQARWQLLGALAGSVSTGSAGPEISRLQEYVRAMPHGITPQSWDIHFFKASALLDKMKVEKHDRLSGPSLKRIRLRSIDKLERSLPEGWVCILWEPFFEVARAYINPLEIPADVSLAFNKCTALTLHVNGKKVVAEEFLEEARYSLMERNVEAATDSLRNLVRLTQDKIALTLQSEVELLIDLIRGKRKKYFEQPRQK